MADAGPPGSEDLQSAEDPSSSNSLVLHTRDVREAIASLLARQMVQLAPLCVVDVRVTGEPACDGDGVALRQTVANIVMAHAKTVARVRYRAQTQLCGGLDGGDIRPRSAVCTLSALAMVDTNDMCMAIWLLEAGRACVRKAVLSGCTREHYHLHSGLCAALACSAMQSLRVENNVASGDCPIAIGRIPVPDSPPNILRKLVLKGFGVDGTDAVCLAQRLPSLLSLDLRGCSVSFSRYCIGVALYASALRWKTFIRDDDGRVLELDRGESGRARIAALLERIRSTHRQMCQTPAQSPP